MTRLREAMGGREGKSESEFGAWGPRDAKAGGIRSSGSGLGKGTSHGVVGLKDRSLEK